MRRRDFLAASCLAGLAPLSRLAQAAEAGEASGKDYYELRRYSVASEDKRKALDEFLAQAAIPAWNRLGIAQVGVFHPQGDVKQVWVLLACPKVETLLTATGRLLADAEFLKAGAGVLEAPKSDLAYDRIESSLMIAFDQAPKLQAPSKAATRVFQLRIYESHSLLKAAKKIEMFNAGGEIAIFRRTGLNPVFFGQTLMGPKMPNLTYMVGFDDMEANKKAWAQFGADPDWKKLRGAAEYKDTVSNITNIVLSPAPSSQI